MSDLACSVIGVDKSFQDGPDRRRVLKEVHMEVHQGALVGLVGPSGGGKSTLLKIVGGMVEPDCGIVRVADEVLDHRNVRCTSSVRRQRVGWMAQEFSLLDGDSVFDNIALPLRFGRGRPGRRQRRAMVERAVEAAALAVDLRRRTSTLSGGERQRVTLARALVRDPFLLLADEPTAALDGATAQRVVESMKAVADRGAGVLIATHDPVVAGLCDRLYHLNDGALLPSDDPARV